MLRRWDLVHVIIQLSKAIIRDALALPSDVLYVLRPLNDVLDVLSAECTRTGSRAVASAP